jgi:ribosomal protein L20
MNGIKQNKVMINLKMLSEIAVNDSEAFAAVVKSAKV